MIPPDALVVPLLALVGVSIIGLGIWARFNKAEPDADEDEWNDSIK